MTTDCDGCQRKSDVAFDQGTLALTAIDRYDAVEATLYVTLSNFELNINFDIFENPSAWDSRIDEMELVPWVI